MSKSRIKYKQIMDGCFPKQVIAQKYIKSKSSEYAVKRLKEIIQTKHPEYYDKLYSPDSELFVARGVFSEQQIDIIDSLMLEDSLRKQTGKMTKYSCFKVSKQTIACMLFKNVFPHVALRRMMLMLDKNFHILNNIFETEAERESPNMDMKQAYKIAKAFKNTEVLDWIDTFVKAKQEIISMADAKSTDGQGWEKRKIYYLYTSISDPKLGGQRFRRMLKQFPGALVEVFGESQNRFERYFTLPQIQAIEKYLGRM